MFRLAFATALFALTTAIAAQDVTTGDLQHRQDSAATSEVVHQTRGQTGPARIGVLNHGAIAIRFGDRRQQRRDEVRINSRKRHAR